MSTHNQNAVLHTSGQGSPEHELLARQSAFEWVFDGLYKNS